MSNDTGITVRNHNDKWRVMSLNISSDHESLIATYNTREDAVERAIKEAVYPVEYGIVHVDPPTHPPLNNNQERRNETCTFTGV